MRTLKSLLLLIPLALALSACSHSRPQTENPGEQVLADSAVEISYHLGHTHRKLLVVSKDSQVTGQNFLDRQILREGTVDASHYNAYFQKTSEFLNKCQRNPASDSANCRNPYILTIRVKDKSQVVKGCRSGEDGPVGRLIRDGEFLLYWKK